MTILEELTGIVSAAFEAAGYAPAYGQVRQSDRPDLCQYQCSGAMPAAKEYRKAPVAIATDVAAALAGNALFARVEVAPPGFLNLVLQDGVLAEKMNKMLADARYLLPQMAPKTIVVDFGGPNVAKPLHVGHLRSAIIGDTLCRIARFLGHKVIGDVHLGDWGLQMGMVIAELQRLQPDLPYFDPNYTGDYPTAPPVTADDLNHIYPDASARAKTDEAFAASAAQATVELQDGRRGYRALWRAVRDVSVTDLKRSYDILGVHFDKWYGESDADTYIPQVVAKLEEKGLLRQSEGAQVVDVALPEDTEPMPPIIIVKSNGGDIYGTTDLGTLLQRVQDWDPDEVWYVVDNRQALHFKQVFRCAALAGITTHTQCSHVGFGTMNGKDGKPYKTRDGGVMRLSDMIHDVTENAYAVTAASGVDMDDAQRQQTAQMIGVAAMKVGDMLNYRTKDYIFDMERFLATEGKTGPYLQYTAVRIGSVLRKAQETNQPLGTILPAETDSERDLMLAFLAAPQALLRSYDEKAPNVICEALFEMAGIFNRFYSENKILACPDDARRASLLSLLKLSHGMLCTLMGLLGVDVPQAM